MLDLAVAFFCSMGIESVVNEKAGRSAGLHDGMCSACEMAVVWMENQLRQNQTQDRILDYLNEVKSPVAIIFSCCLIQNADWLTDSFASVSQAQWENQLLTVESFLPCLQSPSQLVAKCLTSPPMRYALKWILTVILSYACLVQHLSNRKRKKKQEVLLYLRLWVVGFSQSFLFFQWIFSNIQCVKLQVDVWILFGFFQLCSF